jgi:hypothetical protein
LGREACDHGMGCKAPRDDLGNATKYSVGQLRADPDALILREPMVPFVDEARS